MGEHFDGLHVRPTNQQMAYLTVTSFVAQRDTVY